MDDETSQKDESGSTPKRMNYKMSRYVMRQSSTDQVEVEMSEPPLASSDCPNGVGREAVVIEAPTQNIERK